MNASTKQRRLWLPFATGASASALKAALVARPTCVLSALGQCLVCIALTARATSGVACGYELRRLIARPDIFAHAGISIKGLL